MGLENSDLATFSAWAPKPTDPLCARDDVGIGGRHAGDYPLHGAAPEEQAPAPGRQHIDGKGREVIGKEVVERQVGGQRLARRRPEQQRRNSEVEDKRRQGLARAFLEPPAALRQVAKDRNAEDRRGYGEHDLHDAGNASGFSPGGLGLLDVSP